MERPTLRQLLTPTSWEWPSVTLALLILFHQYPLTILSMSSRIQADGGLFTVLPLVCFYVGWKAKECAAVDVALGVMPYAFIAEILGRLRADIPVFRADLWLAVAGLVVFGMAAFVVALAGYVVRNWQLRRRDAAV